MAKTTMNRFLAAWLVPLVVLASIPATPTDSTAPAGATILCVRAPVSALQAMGLQVDEEYDSFVTVKASTADGKMLERAGIPFFHLAGMDEVALPGASFTLSRDEFADKGLGALRGRDAMYVIIKFKGPEKPEWYGALRAAGATPVGGPLSHFNIVARLDAATPEQVARLPFVRWMGDLRPEHKLSLPLPSSGQLRFDMAFFKEAPQDFSAALRLVALWGGTVVEQDCSTDWWNSAVVTAPAALAQRIAQMPGLWCLEPAGVAGPRNDVARWVLQSFDASTLATPYWDAGITGRGVIIGCADSGIDYDHIAFRDAMDDQGTPGLDHRKIIRYNTSIDNWDYAGIGHGTHVAGSLAGDSLITPNGYDRYDGLAYDAKIAFYDIVEADGITWNPPLIRGILGDAYDAGARSHSDSWGDSNTQYTLRAQRMDQFQWDHPDFLSFVAAGNIGPNPHTVLEPATAKNVVAVGNAINGNTTSLNPGSSHGPTEQGLIAPTLVAPGTSIWSAKSDNAPNTYNSDYKTMTGTSMATPLSAASCALVEQYFRDGFYPGGTAGSGPGFLPSGPLRKAVLVASAWDQAGGQNVGGNIPDFGQGWGKILLSNALYLAGNARTPRLWVADYYNDTHVNDGLATGMTRSEQIAVNSSRPLKIVLAWNDWPGAGLVNDLNLEVTAPDGKMYRGNQLVNGSSVAFGAPDVNNTVEVVLISNPVRGVYTINVTALRAGNGGRQGYSLAATGDLYDPGVALLTLDRERTTLESTVGVTLRDVGLKGAGQVTVSAVSTTERAPERITLLETGAGGLFTGTLTTHQAAASPDGVIEVKDGDVVRVYYSDDDPPGITWDELLVDGSPPGLLDWTLENVTEKSAFIRLTTDEPSTATVSYRSAGGAAERSDGMRTFVHGILLDGLGPRTNYSADIVLADDSGNSQNFNFSGGHLNFRTHDLDFRPRAGFAGFAVDSEGGNHFGEGTMSSGLSGGARRIAGARFDGAGFPNGTRITWAQFRLMVQNTDPALSTTTWTVELLAGNSTTAIDPSRSEPIYPLLAGGATEGAVGNAFSISGMVPGRWQYLNLSAGQCAALQASLSNGSAGFRVKANIVTGDDSFVEWYTGASAQTSFWAPQLVMDIDYPPEVAPGAIVAFSMDEDTVDKTHLNMTGIFRDPDGDALVYDARLTGDEPVQNITVRMGTGGAVLLTPRPDWNGMATVRLTATDPYGLAAVHFVNVTVEPVNDPVSIVSINGSPAVDGMSFGVLQDQSAVILVVAQDPDLAMEGDSLRYSTNDSLVRFASSKNGTLAFAPGNDDVGIHAVRITVRDRESETVLNISVEVENVNDPPAAYLVSPAAGEPYDDRTPVWFSALATDPDTRWGDMLTSTWESNQTGVIGHGLDMNATLAPGNHTITLTVMDTAGAYCQTSVEITVRGNSPPVIYSLYPSNQQKFTRGARIQFTAVAGDSDGDSLTYCWTLKGRRLSASPSFYKSDLPAGTHTLLLTVSDGKDTATASLTVEITPASGAGDMYYRLLAVALVVLSMVLGWLLAVPRRPQNVPNLSAEDAEPAGDEKDDGVVDVEAEEE